MTIDSALSRFACYGEETRNKAVNELDYLALSLLAILCRACSWLLTGINDGNGPFDSTNQQTNPNITSDLVT